MEQVDHKRAGILKKTLEKQIAMDYSSLLDLSIKLYEKGYSGLDIMDYVEKSKVDEKKKYQLLLAFHKVKREFRNERLLMFFMLNFLFIRSDFDLENLSFM
jgi:hypothetical protein